jgi:hypothetical protein
MACQKGSRLLTIPVNKAWIAGVEYDEDEIED